jgi:hypothetical protein
MSKIKYTKEQIDFVKNLVEKGSTVTPAARKMCEKWNLLFDDTIGRAMRKKMQKLAVTNNVLKIEDTSVFKEAQNKKYDKTKKRFIITWAQSETKVHTELLKNIKSYAKHIDATIHVIAGRYKSPISLSGSKYLQKSEKNQKLFWAEELIPYLDAARHKIHKHLCILSDVKVQPTASTPLSSMNGITGLESCIIGHPRVHLKSLPVLENYPNKLILTTGAITLENYTDSKSGKKGEFHHQYGFVIVELDGDIFHIRQVVASNDGSFYDLYYSVNNEVVSKHDGAEAIIFGDLHLTEEDKEAVEISFEIDEKLNVKNNIILHDTFNGTSISPHENKLPFEILKKEESGLDNLENELNYVKNFFNSKKDCKFISVRSNHDIWLDRWLNDVDWRKSKNKKMYLELASNLSKDTDNKGVLSMYLKQNNINNVKCLGINDSYVVLGNELAIHGHQGVSGSKGSIVQFKNINTKNITGHSHNPTREDGSVVVGTLTKLRLSYNTGLSSWMHSNAVIYKNGKVQQIHIINGKYTTLN